MPSICVKFKVIKRFGAALKPPSYTFRQNFDYIGINMERREDRKPLTIMVAARIATKRFAAELSDISCRGCRIVSSSVNLTLGDRVTLRPEGMESLTGTVRWSSPEFMGFEFDYPLHPAVVDHLCRQHPSQGQAV